MNLVHIDLPYLQEGESGGENLHPGLVRDWSQIKIPLIGRGAKLHGERSLAITWNQGPVSCVEAEVW